MIFLITVLFGTICTIILLMSIINRYYKFNNKLEEFDNLQKIKFIKNNFLIKSLKKNTKLKIFSTLYILTPLIKINYILTSSLIYLFCELCGDDLDVIILKNNNNDMVITNNFIKYTENKQNTLNTLDLPDLQNISETPNKSDKPTTFDELVGVDQVLTILNNIEKSSKNSNNDSRIDSESNFISKSESNLGLSLEINTKEDISEYLLDDNSIDKNINIVQLKDLNLSNEVSNETYINKEIDKNGNIGEEIIESIELDEIDFGDYMSNLIISSNENLDESIPSLKNTHNIEETENREQNTQIIPLKIKIGKKKK
jgi:hypothetical protein